MSPRFWGTVPPSACACSDLSTSSSPPYTDRATEKEVEEVVGWSRRGLSRLEGPRSRKRCGSAKQRRVLRRKEETADWDKLGGQRSHGGKSGDQNERKGGTKNGQSSNVVWTRREGRASEQSQQHTHLPSMMVMTSLTWMWSLSASSKSCRAHMSVGIV